MTNEAEKESVELTSLDHSIYWLKAIIEQRARIFDAEAQPTKHLQSAQYNNRQNMEEQFFLSACGKAQRWIGPMTLQIPEAIQFTELKENIMKVRDEREHDEERYGSGNNFEDVTMREHAEKGSVLKRPRPGQKYPKSRPKFRMEEADTDGGGSA